MARMADVRGARHGLGETAHGEHEAASRQLLEEVPAGEDFGTRRGAVRTLGARMGGHDVPAERVAGDADLFERRTDNRRRRLRWPGARELPLGGEREAADAGAAVAGRLADEQ